MHNSKTVGTIGRRYIDSEGNLKIRRKGGRSDWSRDLYHLMIGMRWSRFIPLLGLVFMILNTAFASLYWLHGEAIAGAHPGSFSDCFFFSVQTLATIGYGAMAPRGLFGNWMVCIEAYVGLMSFAMMSGLSFAKFSVPQSRVIFSKTLIVSQRNGCPALMFRMANARGNQIMEVRVHLTAVIDSVTQEGEEIRRLIRLPLMVADSPIFALSFLATHLLDENSPLYGKSAQQLREENCEFIVTFVGIDGTLGQTVHGRKAYRAEEIRWGHRFVDTVDNDPAGFISLDLGRFHDTVPINAESTTS